MGDSISQPSRTRLVCSIEIHQTVVWPFISRMSDIGYVRLQQSRCRLKDTWSFHCLTVNYKPIYIYSSLIHAIPGYTSFIKWMENVSDCVNLYTLPGRCWIKSLSALWSTLSYLYCINRMTYKSRCMCLTNQTCRGCQQSQTHLFRLIETK